MRLCAQFLLNKNAELIDKIKEVSLMNHNSDGENDGDDEYDGYTPSSQPIPYIHVRIINYAPLTKVKLIKANFYGSLK